MSELPKTAIEEIATLAQKSAVFFYMPEEDIRLDFSEIITALRSSVESDNRIPEEISIALLSEYPDAGTLIEDIDRTTEFLQSLMTQAAEIAVSQTETRSVRV